MARVPKNAPEATAGRGGPAGDIPGLTLTATPIGNLGDLPPRAVESLEGADILACEDTRHTGKMLKRLGIRHGKLMAYHDHSPDSADRKLVDMMLKGASVTLVSNAGTPVVSDPGFGLVRLCIEEGVPVTAVPGPSAVVTALVMSGLPADRFTFAGFLPQQPGKRRSELEGDLGGGRAGTLVYYESPKRLRASLGDIAEIAPDRRVAVARELTKLHEEVLRGTAGEVLALLDAGAGPRGEVVLMVGPGGKPAAPNDAEVEVLLGRAIADGHSRRDAARLVSEATGLPRRDVYGLALGMDDGYGDGGKA